jgi:hypothetical protein
MALGVPSSFLTNQHSPMARNPGKRLSFHHFDGQVDGAFAPPRVGSESPRSNPRELLRQFLCPVRVVNTAASKKYTRIGSFERWDLPSHPPLFCYVCPSSRHMIYAPLSRLRTVIWWIASENSTPPMPMPPLLPSPPVPSALQIPSAIRVRLNCP